MSDGVLCFAHNNGSIDYIKQAAFLAKRVKQHLDIPVSVVTSTPDKINKKHSKLFDNIIFIDDDNTNSKRYNDGQNTHQNLYFKNNGRINSYDLTPYDRTLVLDTDYIICNDVFKNAFGNGKFQIYRDGVDLCSWRKHAEFDYINNKGIPFYWATCFYFEKDLENKIFFDTLKQLQSNWSYYSTVYDLGSRNFRNDHIFSMGIHIMNGFSDSHWAKLLPGKMFYTLDRDKLYKLDNDKLVFMLEKESRVNEYVLSSTDRCNVHVMNKFSLERVLDV